MMQYHIQNELLECLIEGTADFICTFTVIKYHFHERFFNKDACNLLN